MNITRDLAAQSKAWPLQEAVKLLDVINKQTPAKDHVLFETGFGASGLPHIGTFTEVARTAMIRHAFTQISDLPTRLITFSDDMDALRKVPQNLPQQDMLHAHLGQPLTKIPDPFGTHESFGHHNNARLRAFLDRFGFPYEFLSATECYQSGMFDATLLKILAHYDAIIEIILPTLGAERRRTYSPFLPVSPHNGEVLQVPILEHDVAAGTVIFEDVDGRKVELPVTGGHCKLQWKADWAMRWVALDVDYEMSGKDLIDSVRLSSQICRLLGKEPPQGFHYELFLDEQGEKISKSRGNGLTIDEWLEYAPPESLSYYIYQSPRKAKRLFFDVIPKAVDEYLSHLARFGDQPPAKQLANPVWHVHDGVPPVQELPVSFNLLLNLAGACHTEDKAILWTYIRRYAPDVTPESCPFLDQLVGHAVHYYQRFVKPTKKYRLPERHEQDALTDLLAMLQNLPPDPMPEAIQTEIYEIGKRHDFSNLRDWFRALYEIMLGQSQGPRMGSFIALYGIPETISLIEKVLAGQDLASELQD